MLHNWLERSRRAGGLVAAVLLAGLLFGAESALAQQGAVGGQVTDAETLQPVVGAQVFVPGTTLGTLTTDEGRYRLDGVPVGEVRVRVQLIGFRDSEQTVTVQAGQITTADFQLEETALRLRDIVVTGVVGETPRVKLPFTVDRLEAEDLPVPSSNVSGLLQGKVAGISVVSSSGQPGSESDILLRGPTSIDNTGRSEGPLVVVDGVVASTGGGLADINSLDIESIEIVKGAAAAALFGARAQKGVIRIKTKRGQDLQAGTFDVIARGEFGTADLEKQWPQRRQHILAMNESQTAFVNENGDEVPYGDQTMSELACNVGTPSFCFQDNPFPTVNNNFTDFFDPGETTSGYGAVSGAAGGTNFRASAEYFTEEGVLGDLKEGFERINARLNLDTRIGDQLDLSASGFVARSESDGTADFFGILFMSPAIDIGRKTIGGQRSAEECTGTGPDDDCWFVVDPDPNVARGNPLAEQERNPGPFDERKRTQGSLDAVWSPIEFFSLEGNFSYDRTDFNRFNQTFKLAPQGEAAGRARGFLSQSDFIQEAINASVTASFNKAFLDRDLTTRTKVRYSVEDQDTDSFSASGTDIVVQGISSLSGLVDQTTFSLNSQITEIKSQGFFLISSWDYKGRYILDGLVRRDGSSLFGPDERWRTYFRGSGAWRVAQEPWFNVGPVDELKLRYSIGTAGGRPNFFAQFETFAIGAGGTLTFNTLGNTALQPEFSTEQEAGINLVLFDRVGLDGSYSFQKTEDQLLPVPLPAPFGFSEQWQNAGEVEAKTWEASLNASIIDSREAAWTTRLTFDRTTQEITALDVPPFKFGPATQTGPNAFFARPGEEIGAFYGTVWMESCADLESTFGIGQSDCQASFDVNDDGYLVWVGEGNAHTSGPGPDGTVQTADDLWNTTGEVAGQPFEWGRPMAATRVDEICLEVDPSKTAEECKSDFIRMGSSQPDWSLKLSNTFRYKGFSLYGLLDATYGFEVYNQSRQWSTAPESSGSGTLEVDQAGKPEELKKPLVYYDNWLYSGNNFNSHFVEDGSFLKLREASLSYTFGENLLRRAFGGTIERATISVIGRNLLTITDYTGYDPEVGFGQGTGDTGPTGSAALTRFDAFTYPNFRTVTASVELVF